MRNRAHYSAYQILGSIVIAALLYWHLDLRHFDGALPSPDITERDASWVLVCTLWLIVTLPTSIIVWNEPDPHEGDITERFSYAGQVAESVGDARSGERSGEVRIR